MTKDDKSETRYILAIAAIWALLFAGMMWCANAHAACFTVGNQVQCTPEVNDYRNDNNSLKLYTPDGQYRGNVNSNQLDPNSISNPLGKYGSDLSPLSPNNPYSRPAYIGDIK